MLKDIKILLEIPEGDTTLDARLNLIINATIRRLKCLLGGIEVPDDLMYIVTEVSVIRFNRIGSEGLSSHSVEGESLSFSDNDFSGYQEDIQVFLNTQKNARRGRVRFL